MTEQTVKNRGWVKNAAIIFLSVMLALTFFSNTILNYSLPEVSGQYVNPGEINASIRGSGTVAANMSYNVVLDETREIKSVLVKQGDVVTAGQPMILLEDSESAELKTATDTLESMKLDYARALVDAEPGLDNLELRNMREDLQKAIEKREKIGELTAMLEQCKANTKAAQKNVNALTKLIEDINEELAELKVDGKLTDPQLKAKQQSLNLAQQTLDAANESYEAAKAAEEELSAGTTVETAQKAVDALERTVENLEQDLDYLRQDQTALENKASLYRQLKAIYDSAVEQYSAAQAAVDDLEEQLEASPGDAGLQAQLEAAREDLDFAKVQMNQAQTNLNGVTAVTDAELTAMSRSIESKRRELQQAEEDLADARENLSDAKADAQDLKEAKSKTASAKQWVNACQSNVNSAKSILEGALNARKEVLENQLDTTNVQLDAAKDALTEAQEAQEEAAGKNSQTVEQADAAILEQQRSLEKQLLTLSQKSELSDLSLADSKRKIEAQEKLVEDLRASSVDANITAQYGGIISSLSCVAGDTVNAGTTLASIEVADKGYTVSFTVTQEQSRKVRVGDTAKVSNWWNPDLQVVLKAIKNDPTGAGQNKQLTFDVTGGGVEVGQTLNLSIGERSAYYDVIVPNSAVREDSNGTFILVAEAKSTPLGNRYTATRYDVSVLAKDDQNSAVSGLYGGEYVITASTKPVDAKSQVRLVDK